MAAVDARTGTPIRSDADGADEKVLVKITDGSVGGTNQVTVDTDKNLHVEVHGNDGTGTDRIVLLSEEGATIHDGIYDAALNTNPSTSGLTAQTRNAAAAKSRQNLQPTAKRGATASDTVSLDIALHDASGEAFSNTNPLPVFLANDASGTPVHDYHESAAVLAPAASITYDYTVAGTALTLQKVTGTASGRFKLEVFTGNATTPTQKYTLFGTASSPNIPIDVPKNSIVAVADIVRVKFTNMDDQSFTVYSMIEGTLA